MTEVRRTVPDWPPERFDHNGNFKKRTLPGWVRVEVAKSVGATPGTTTKAACAYCGAEGGVWWPLTYTNKVGTWVALVGLEFDHVIAEYRGGPSTPDNIVLACRPCNRSKGHR